MALVASKSKEFKGIRSALVTPLLLVLAVASAGAAVYVYQLYQKSQQQVKLLENPQEVTRAETERLAERVKSLVAVPEDEAPTIATVVDAEKLRVQGFFARAENGDRVLIYPQAKVAVLYRPRIDKVINVAPVNIGEGQPQNLRVVMYNGTDTPGATKPAEDKLTAQVKNLEIVNKQNASSQDYSQTIVVDLAGNQADAANRIAQVLGAKVEAIPAGENRPANADFLIIVGGTSE